MLRAVPRRRVRARGWTLALGVVVLAAGVVVALVASSAGPSRRDASGAPVPAAARSTVALLGANSIEAQRSVLTEAADEVLPVGWIFPSGTTVRLVADSWHASGAYANGTATVAMPGQVPATYEVGFMRQGSAWRVTFAEPTP